MKVFIKLLVMNAMHMFIGKNSSNVNSELELKKKKNFPKNKWRDSFELKKLWKIDHKY